jgi:hypothetical protein
VVKIATCDGASGGEVVWWLERRREREREIKTAEIGAKGLVFGRFWTRISPPSGYEMHPYL